MFSLPNWLRRIRGRRCSRCGKYARRYVSLSGRPWCERCAHDSPQQFLEELKHATRLETQSETIGGMLTIPPHSARIVRLEVLLDDVETDIHRTAW